MVDFHSQRSTFIPQDVYVCVRDCRAAVYVWKSNSLRCYSVPLSHAMQRSSCLTSSSVVRSLLQDCFRSQGRRRGFTWLQPGIKASSLTWTHAHWCFHPDTVGHTHAYRIYISYFFRLLFFIPFQQKTYNSNYVKILNVTVFDKLN